MHITDVILAPMTADGCTSFMFVCLLTNWIAGSLKTSSSPQIVDCCVWLLKINQRQLLTFLLYGWRPLMENGVVIRQGRTIIVVNPSSLSYSRSRSRARVRICLAFVFARCVLQLRSANCVMQLLTAIFRVNVYRTSHWSWSVSLEDPPFEHRINDRQYQRVNKTRCIVSSRRWHVEFTWNSLTDERSI